MYDKFINPKGQVYMEFRIKEARENAGYSQKELAKIIGVAQNTLHGYESGKHDPKSDLLIEIAKACRVTTDFLLGHESKNDFEGTKNPKNLSKEAQARIENHIEKYRLLDQYGQEAVDSVLDVEWRRCKEEEDKKKKIEEVKRQRDQMETAEEMVYFVTPGFLSPMSAGTGQPAGSEYPENYRLIKEPPRGTSYIAPVSGDSMEPTFHDGDKLFIRACTEINLGQIGVFFMDGQQWVKELGDNALISHNEAYEPRVMTEDIRCQGLVLGVCDESYFE